MNELQRMKDQAYILWAAKPEGMRTAQQKEDFVDELWGSGLRLDRSQNNHCQLVMDAIRRH